MKIMVCSDCENAGKKRGCVRSRFNGAAGVHKYRNIFVHLPAAQDRHTKTIQEGHAENVNHGPNNKIC